MHMRRLTLVLLLAMLPNLACGPSAPDESTDDTGIPGTDMPAIGADTLWIEGQPEVLSVRRFTSDTGFPIRFTTLIPAGVAVETVSSGEGDAVLFLAVSGAVTRDSVRLAFTVLPERHQPTATESLVRERARRGSDVRDSRGPGWAETFARREGLEAAGWVGSGKRHDRTFLIDLDYLPEFGDGFEPRANYILENWVWLDTNEPLGHTRIDP
jgi:hypothetical protein